MKLPIEVRIRCGSESASDFETHPCAEFVLTKDSEAWEFNRAKDYLKNLANAVEKEKPE